MIDTIILEVPDEDYFIDNEGRFRPHASRLMQQGYNGERFVNNASTSELRAGKYLPRLTIIRRVTKYDEGKVLKPLRIEFSAAKLLFGNNVEEVTEEDFPEIFDRLQAAIAYMGVAIPRANLMRAHVVAFHPSKNFELHDGYTSGLLLRDLSKINLTKQMDLTKTDFREGQSLQYYSKVHSLVMYDKIADLRRPQKRAIDKDKTGCELDILSKLKGADIRKEIFRMEVRLAKKVKVRQVLLEVCQQSSLEFPDIFKNRVCNKILLYYWDKYIASDAALLSFDDPISLFEDLRRAYPNQQTKEHFMLLGLLLLTKEAGQLYLKNSVSYMYTARTWQRLKKVLEAAAKKVGFQKTYLTQIRADIIQDKPYRLTEL